MEREYQIKTGQLEDDGSAEEARVDDHKMEEHKGKKKGSTGEYILTALLNLQARCSLPIDIPNVSLWPQCIYALP